MFKELRVEGVGSSSKHHDPISKQDINQLWETCVLATKAPMQLLNAIFFTTGLYCCLHGGKEHRSVFLDSKHTLDPDMWTYTERASKNWNTRLPDDVVLPWFSNQAAGKNKLNTMVKRMRMAAGVPPKQTTL